MNRLIQLFCPTPSGDPKAYIAVLSLSMAVALIGLLLMLQRKPSRATRATRRIIITIGVASLLIYTFRLEGVQYFDVDAWIYGLGMVVLFSVMWGAWFYGVRHPQIKKAAAKQHIMAKYMPTAKK